MNNDHHPTGFTYELSVVPDYPGYEWLPEPDESGRTIYKPHKMETKSPEAMQIRRLNHQIDCLLEIAKQKMTRPTLEENLQIHREISEVLHKWRSEGIVRIHPQEVETLTIYQLQLLTRMDQQREERAEHLIEQEQVVEQVAITRERIIPLPPIMFEGFKR